LLAWPTIVAESLFAAQVSGVGVIVARLTGACLIALSVACWPAGDSRRAFQGMLLWSVLAALILIIVGTGGHTGILLWPAVAVHAIFAVLLLNALRRTT
jgi:hypothetical protein